MVGPGGGLCVGSTGGVKPCDGCATCFCPGTQTPLPLCCCIPIGQAGSCAGTPQCQCCMCADGRSLDPNCCVPGSPIYGQTRPGQPCNCLNATCCGGTGVRLILTDSSVMTITGGDVPFTFDRRCKCVAGMVTEHVGNQCIGPAVLGDNFVNMSGGTPNCRPAIARGVNYSCSVTSICPQQDTLIVTMALGESVSLSQGGRLTVTDPTGQHITDGASCSGMLPAWAYFGGENGGCLGTCNQAQAQCGTWGGGQYSVTNCSQCGPQGAILMPGRSSGIIVPDRTLLIPGAPCLGCEQAAGQITTPEDAAAFAL